MPLSRGQGSGPGWELQSGVVDEMERAVDGLETYCGTWTVLKWHSPESAFSVDTRSQTLAQPPRARQKRPGPVSALPGCLQVEHGVLALIGTGGCHSGDQ